jgi:DNA-3-methyladenine glycosylase
VIAILIASVHVNGNATLIVIATLDGDPFALWCAAVPRKPSAPPLSIAALRAQRLGAAWYARSPIAVARGLVGCALVHGDRAGMIVETEAYLGPEDRASHARFGPTARTAVMFGPGGVSYVYLCYGVHEMFNIVAGADGRPGAVLIRAIAPLAGLPDDPAVGRGPGKVTRALALDRSHDRLALDGDALFVAAHRRPRRLATGPRIGVDYAGAWAARPLRFTWPEHPAVSGPRARRR